MVARELKAVGKLNHETGMAALLQVAEELGPALELEGAFAELAVVVDKIDAH